MLLSRSLAVKGWLTEDKVVAENTGSKEVCLLFCFVCIKKRRLQHACAVWGLNSTLWGIDGKARRGGVQCTSLVGVRCRLRNGDKREDKMYSSAFRQQWEIWEWRVLS